MSNEVAVPTEDEISHLYAWLRGGLPHCGCGNPEESERLVVTVLDLLADDAPYEQIALLIGGGTATEQIVLGAIEHAGLASHGGSQRYSWITERGDWVRRVYRRMKDPDTELDETGFPHDGVECPSECPLGKLSAESAPSDTPDWVS